MASSIIFHVDVNSAFLSWESVYRLNEMNETTDLRLIPSAVGGDQSKRHGVILAKSTPAKQYNIQTGEPIVQALRKCPNLTIVPVRFDIYEKYSKAFHDLLHEYTPHVEKYSIDEAYMDLRGSHVTRDNAIPFATKLKDRIYTELGFTVNVGISTNKLLAKMAGDFKKPNLVHTLFEDEIQKKMWPLDVRELLFVGKSTQQKLYRLGIHTIGDLANANYDMLIAHFGKHGAMIYEYANGIDHSPVISSQADPKGYSNSTTISHDVIDGEEAKRILLALCEHVALRLREDDVCASVLSVSMTDCYFQNRSHQMSLMSATNTTNEIYQHICELFDSLWDKKTPIRLLGVHATKLTKESYKQYNLFDMQKYENYSKLDKTLDEIRKKFGSNSIVRASLLTHDETNMNKV